MSQQVNVYRKLSLYDGASIEAISGQNLPIDTVSSNKTIRINSRTYTTAASIIGLQTKPRAGVTITNDIIGIEAMPGINSGFGAAGIVCFNAEPYIHSTAGAISGDVRGYEVSLGCPSGAGTIAGVLSGLKCVNNTAKAVTGGIFPIYVVTHGDSQAWTSFAKLPDDGVIAKSSEDKSAGTEGWLKVTIGTTAHYISCWTG